MTLTDAVVVLALVAALVLWLIGEWTATHWYAVLRWSHRREARRRERSGNPYQAARRRGFWYGLIIGASFVGIAWRIWR